MESLIEPDQISKTELIEYLKLIRYQTDDGIEFVLNIIDNDAVDYSEKYDLLLLISDLDKIDRLLDIFSKVRLRAREIPSGTLAAIESIELSILKPILEGIWIDRQLTDGWVVVRNWVWVNLSQNKFLELDESLRWSISDIPDSFGRRKKDKVIKYVNLSEEVYIEVRKGCVIFMDRNKGNAIAQIDIKYDINIEGGLIDDSDKMMGFIYGWRCLEKDVDEGLDDHRLYNMEIRVPVYIQFDTGKYQILKILSLTPMADETDISFAVIFEDDHRPIVYCLEKNSHTGNIRLSSWKMLEDIIVLQNDEDERMVTKVVGDNLDIRLKLESWMNRNWRHFIFVMIGQMIDWQNFELEYDEWALPRLVLPNIGIDIRELKIMYNFMSQYPYQFVQFLMTNPLIDKAIYREILESYIFMLRLLS